MRTLIIALAIALTALAPSVTHAAARQGVADPEVHVTVTTPSVDVANRKGHEDTVRRVLLDAFKCAAATPGEFGFDVSVTKLSVDIVRGHVEISAELHVVISDRDGNILSYVTGSAVIEAPNRARAPERMAQLEHQAIAEAADGVIHPLRVQLLRTAARRAELLASR